MKKNAAIVVVAHATYSDDQSIIEDKRYLWAYEIIIENKTEEVVQLLNRYWRVTDMTGHIEEIRGPGVIGLQPLIKPGKSFTYNSFCQLAVPQGSMEGYYEMQNLDETRFIVEIPKFVLVAPQGVVPGSRSQLH